MILERHYCPGCARVTLTRVVRAQELDDLLARLPDLVPGHFSSVVAIHVCCNCEQGAAFGWAPMLPGAPVLDLLPRRKGDTR
jgi:hypothetical protein